MNNDPLNIIIMRKINDVAINLCSNDNAPVLSSQSNYISNQVLTRTNFHNIKKNILYIKKQQKYRQIRTMMHFKRKINTAYKKSWPKKRKKVKKIPTEKRDTCI